MPTSDAVWIADSRESVSYDSHVGIFSGCFFESIAAEFEGTTSVDDAFRKGFVFSSVSWFLGGCVRNVGVRRASGVLLRSSAVSSAGRGV